MNVTDHERELRALAGRLGVAGDVRFPGWVSSREVEEAIYAVEGVSEVAVIGLPDSKWIEAVTAVIVAKPGCVLTEQGVVSACAGRLATFKLPKRVILTDALPKNPTGKLLKRELRLKYATSEEA